MVKIMLMPNSTLPVMTSLPNHSCNKINSDKVLVIMCLFTSFLTQCLLYDTLWLHYAEYKFQGTAIML